MQGVSHIIKGEEFTLLPDKVVYWAARKAILLADLHLGKVTHFRKAGIGLPKSVEQENLEKLSQLLLDFDVETVYILGDLFHSHYNAEWDQFKYFLSKFSEIQFELIMGNHDILDSGAYVATNLECHPEILELSPFIMTHIPDNSHPSLYNICGHLHPGVKLRGKGLQSIKLPCFHFSSKGLVLPAFGAFTGTARIEPSPDDAIYAISDQKVFKVL